MYCITCGTNIHGGDSYCRYCGNRVQQEIEIVQNNDEGVKEESVPTSGEIELAQRHSETTEEFATDNQPADENPLPTETFVQEIKTSATPVQVQAPNTASYYYGPDSPEVSVSPAAINSSSATVSGTSGATGMSGATGASGAPVTQMFFGKAAFILCVSVIGALSVTCGVLLGIVIS
ncbi:MAG: hypothetical protein FWH05_01205 [Oscillospiraceae bacterium]|nr:hypothetical protein [Oscillospiraceae bacterium]